MQNTEARVLAAKAPCTRVKYSALGVTVFRAMLAHTKLLALSRASRRRRRMLSVSVVIDSSQTELQKLLGPQALSFGFAQVHRHNVGFIPRV